MPATASTSATAAKATKRSIARRRCAVDVGRLLEIPRQAAHPQAKHQRGDGIDANRTERGQKTCRKCNRTEQQNDTE